MEKYKDLLFDHLKSENEYVHFISLVYGIINDLDKENEFFEIHRKIINSIELLKASTLIIDDFIDSTESRNNKLSISEKYGGSKAVLIGEQLKSHATISFIEGINELPLPEKNKIASILIFEDCFRTVSTGQLEDIDKLVYSSEMRGWEQKDWEKYYKVYIDIIFKTTSVFLMIPFLVSKQFGVFNNDDLVYYKEYFGNIGIAYQMRDDLFDALGESLSSGKELGGDILEKKIRLPLIKYFMHESKLDKKDVFDFFESDMQNEKVKYIVNLITRSNSFTNTISAQNEYCIKALNAIKALEDSKKNQYLIDLAEYIKIDYARVN